MAKPIQDASEGEEHGAVALPGCMEGLSSEGASGSCELWEVLCQIRGEKTCSIPEAKKKQQSTWKKVTLNHYSYGFFKYFKYKKKANSRKNKELNIKNTT